MSYTNKTTHYEIPLPTQNDLVNGLDWNTSSEAIDTAIYEASQAAQQATGDIANIKQDIVDLKAEDVLIEEAATELTGRVGTLEQNATLDEAAIQDAFDMITDTEVTQAQSDIEIAEGQWFRYNGVLYVATTAIHIDDPIVPNTNCRATNIEDEMPSGGEVVDVTARAEIGTMANLNTTDKSSLVAAINEVLTQIGGGGMPELDYTNPLYEFDSTHTNYTAVDECYVLGTCVAIDASADIKFTVNGKEFANVYAFTNNVYNTITIPTLRLAAGDVIAVYQETCQYRRV